MRRLVRWRFVGFLSLLIAAPMVFAAPMVVAAHPIGNFTINQYLGVHLEPDVIEVDMVIDRAEIPTSQLLDDTEPTEQDLGRIARSECDLALAGVDVRVDDSAATELEVVRSAASAPAGTGGLPTLRVECLLRGDADLTGATRVSVENRNFPDRLGWAEIVVTTVDVEVRADLPAESVTDRLASYPEDLLASPPDVRATEFPISLRQGVTRGVRFDPSAQPGIIVRTGDRFSSLLGEATGGARAVVLSLGVAFVLGAGHAMAPGHGKTVMAASLVGTHGRPRHALILGTSVAVSHTLGVLVLGIITFFASAAFAPETVFPYLSALSGAIITAIGGWILVQWAKGRRNADGAPDRRHGVDDHGPAGDRRHRGGLEHDVASDVAGRQEPHAHSHGGREHRHAVVGDREITWKLLATLGLSGGLVPSVSAILLLLAAINLGRIGLGVLLILMFGIGMAVTLVGVGVGVVLLGEKGMQRFEGSGWIARSRSLLAPVAGAIVMGVGLVLTARAAIDIFA